MTTPTTLGTTGQTTVKTDSAALRRAAAVLQERAAALQKAAKSLAALPPTVDTASGQFLSHHAPKEVYHGAVSSLKALSDKFATEADHAVRTLSEKADALLKTTDKHDATEDKNAKDMDRIGDRARDIAPHGGTSTKPAPTTGDKPVAI
ncbi:hypothetical protein [Mycobacterium servetii]|uniref:Uncharacterized protein n=1 Tax=Mycobacterium servetii TaxID=3237418 RepID=A0ABV4BUG6_9MYCO